MQQLFDFIYEHALDEKVFLLAVTRDDRQIELFWRRHEDADHWRLRFKDSGDELTVARTALLSELGRRGVALEPLRRELESIVTTQIVYADMLLSDARRTLGRDVVRKAVLTHRDFMGQLGETLRQIQRQPLTAISGGGNTTEGKRGHLRLA